MIFNTIRKDEPFVHQERVTLPAACDLRGERAFHHPQSVLKHPPGFRLTFEKIREEAFVPDFAPVLVN